MWRERQKESWVAPETELPFIYSFLLPKCSPTVGSGTVPACPMPQSPWAMVALDSEIAKASSLCLWWVTASPADITGTWHPVFLSTEPFLQSALGFIPVLCGGVTSKCTILAKLHWQVFTVGKIFHEMFQACLEQRTKGKKRKTKIINSLLLLAMLVIRVSHF